MDTEAPTTTAEADIRADLLERYGPLLSGAALCRAMGYPSLAAMRQSITRDTFPVPTFLIDGRRGRFALTWVVARWLATRQFDALKRGGTPPATASPTAATRKANTARTNSPSRK